MICAECKSRDQPNNRTLAKIVILTVCASYCLFVMAENTLPNFTNFLCTLPVCVARSSSGGIPIRYVLPVLWIRHVFT